MSTFDHAWHSEQRDAFGFTHLVGCHIGVSASSRRMVPGRVILKWLCSRHYQRLCSIARSQQLLVESMGVGGSPVAGSGRLVACQVCGQPAFDMLRARRQDEANQAETLRQHESDLAAL